MQAQDAKEVNDKMAQAKKSEDPGEREQAGSESVPEQRQEEQEREQRHEEERERRVERQERQMGEQARATDSPPRITVLGHMDSQIAVRLGWRKGMTAISVSRFRFLRDDLGFEVNDDPENYLF